MNDEGPVVIGDIEQQVADDFKPVLSAMGMEKTITIYNPMPVDFRVRYVRSVPVNAPLSPEARFAQEKSGLDLSRRGGAFQHVSHTIVLQANSYKNLPGDIAQIAVQKLISVIIQTRNDDGSYDFSGQGGNKGMVPDPQKRKDVESEVVKEIKDTMSMMNQETPMAFTERQISEMNEVNHEPDNPAPGTGVNYTPTETVPGGSKQPSGQTAGAAETAELPAKRSPGRPKKTEIVT